MSLRSRATVHLSAVTRARLRAEDKHHPGQFRHLNVDDVIAIRALRAAGYSQDDIALSIGCSQRAVSRALAGETETARLAS